MLQIKANFIFFEIRLSLEKILLYKFDRTFIESNKCHSKIILNVAILSFSQVNLLNLDKYKPCKLRHRIFIYISVENFVNIFDLVVNRNSVFFSFFLFFFVSISAFWLKNPGSFQV